jgi:hypothetical protein
MLLLSCAGSYFSSLGEGRAMLRLAAFSLACCVISDLVSIAHAANRTWTAPVSGDFADGTKWTGGVPGPADSATFNTVGTYTVTFDNNPNALPNPVLNQDLAVFAGNITFTSGAGGPYTYRLTGAGGDDAIIAGGALTLGTSGNPLNLVVDDDLQIRGNATLLANFGSDITTRDLILGDSTAPAGGGTLTIDGQDSVLTVTGSAQLGNGGETGTITLRNKAMADFVGTLGLADNTSAMNSPGVLNVHSGATITTSHIRLGPNAIAGQSGRIDLGDGVGTSTITQDTNATLVIGSSASAFPDTGTLQINDGGVFNSGGGSGTVTINQTGRIILAPGGTLNLNGDTTLDGGTIQGSNLINIAAGRRLTAQNDAGLNFGADDVEFNGATVNVNSGSDFVARSMNFGRSGGTMTVTVDGMGSLVSAGSFGGTWGDNGSTANVTIRNGGRADVGGELHLAQSATAGTTATVNIESGGQLFLRDDLVIADDGGGTGTINVSGAGSVVSQTSGGITLGHASAGSATINVNTGGRFSTASGNITIKRTGQINIAGGTLELNGLVIVDGGSITRTSGTLDICCSFLAENDAQINLGAAFDSALLRGRIFHINSGADLIFGDGHILDNITILTVDGAGSSLVMPGESTLSNNSRITIRNGAGAELGSLLLEPTSVVTIDGGTVEMNTLTNNGGTIEFLAGSLSYVGNLTVGTGGLLGENLTLDSNHELTLTGTTTVDASRTLTLTGGSLSTGSLVVNGAFNFDSGRLAITGGAGLTIGAGRPLGATVLLSEAADLEVDETLSIMEGATLFSAGHLNVGSAVVRSGGKMYANGSFAAGSVNIASGGQLFLGLARPDFGAGLTNNGDLVFTDSTMVNDAVTNNGAITALADVTFNDPVNGAGGFYGAGTITFDGGFSPGASPAAVSFEGDVVFGASNTLSVEIGGTELGAGYDSLRIDGQAALGGALGVSLINGFAPNVGNSFEVLHADAGIFDTFATTSLPALATGLDWNVVYSNFAVLLQVIAAGLPGDYNQNGTVDAADYVVWRKTDGSQAGYDVWRTNFGRTAGSGSSLAAAVPEPQSLLLLLVAVPFYGPWLRYVGGSRT